MTLDLEPIKARLAAATPGPWMRQEIDDDHEGGGVIYLSTYICDYLQTGIELAHARSEWDANLIANAPTDLAALVDEVERLRAEKTLLIVEAENLRSAIFRACDHLSAVADAS